MNSSYTLEQTFFNQFRKFLQERIELKTKFVVSGAAENYADYRERVGELNELDVIIREYETLLKAFDPY